MLASIALALLVSHSQTPHRFLTSHPQQESPAISKVMQAALAKLKAKDYAAAAEFFEQATQEEPDNPRAWYLLGFALHATGDYETALNVHVRAAEFEAVRANACYNAACACAMLGRTEKALEWLNKSLEAGFSNISQLWADKDLASLRNDPRFMQLMPRDTPLSFQEEPEILLELRGENAGDRFGWIGRNAGDVNSDGINDLLLSAPFASMSGSSAGRVYLYSGANGDLLWKADGQPGFQLGYGIESAGDMNGDGIPDQVVGAPGAFGTGAAFAYSGRDGSILAQWNGAGQGDRFGSSISGAGDMNGDGLGDIIIGAPYHDLANRKDSGRDAGQVTVFSGKDKGALLVLDGEAPGDLFGRAVDAYSGQDAKFLIIGANEAGPKKRGRVYVYGVEKGQAAERFRIEGREGDSELGMMFVSAVGDVNGDGVMDVYASDWGASSPGKVGCGRIYVHSGKDGSLLHAFTGETPGEGFGIGSSEAGDVDGDGCDDLIVGSWQFAGGAPGAGKCTLFSGRTGSVLSAYVCKNPGETFGFDTTNLGDVNGDDVPDFLITNADSFVHGPQSGRVVVLAGPTANK